MSSKQSDDLMSSLSATSGPSIEGLSLSEASRVLSRRRALLRLLELEVRLVEGEIKRMRGANTPSSATSISVPREETPERRTSTSQPGSRTGHGSSSASGSPHLVMERLELASLSQSSSLVGGLEVVGREEVSPRPALTPRPASSVVRGVQSSRTSRSTSSGERHASRLPRSLVQQLAERESQEAARQLEALRLRGSAQQKEMQMRAQAIKAQTEVVRTAAFEVYALEKKHRKKRNSVTLETLRRWISEGWLAGTERELQKLRLGLSASRLRQKRSEFEPSAADLALMEVHNQKREEQLANLHAHFQNTYFQSGSCLVQKERALRTVECKDAEVAQLRRDVAARRKQTQEQRSLLFGLSFRKQELMRRALALEQSSEQTQQTLKMVTEYVCLKEREKELRKDLTTWERRRGLLNSQLQTVRRRRRALASNTVAAPQCTPTGSESHNEPASSHVDHVASSTSVLSDDVTSASETASRIQSRTSTPATSSSRH